MAEQLRGRTAVVTGAGSGIGRAIAVEMAAEGARLVVLDYDEARARDTAREIEAAGGTARSVRGDVSVEVDVDRAVELAVSEFGVLDIMVNNAGVFDQNAPCVETSNELWDRVMAVDVRGTFFGVRRALREMLPRGQGSIVNMASVAGFVAEGGGAVYTAAKHAIVGLTKQVACEVGAQGVRVNALAPGLVFTGLFDNSSSVLGGLNPTGPLAAAAKERMTGSSIAAIPMGRGAEPQEVARVAVFLASDASSYVTGQTIVVDGGYIAH
ncbi:MAG TPA: glucose 1-dehydrogenase [Candidatus Dormibacteraeota bacterium]|nr:glucose 1-dehydrogenase [Candidatus Dormibacteraeota bacterium]